MGTQREDGKGRKSRNGPQEHLQETDTPSPSDYEDLFRRLVSQANQGDREAIKRLKVFLDKNPAIWERAGDLTAIAERAWIDLIAGPNQLVSESARRRVAQLKESLAGPHPTPLERLLIDQVAVCWLGANHSEVEAASPSGGSLDQATFRLRRAESAQKRLMNATKTLALLRAALPKGLVPSTPLRLFGSDVKEA